jgi:hypothetical protein
VCVSEWLYRILIINILSAVALSEGRRKVTIAIQNNEDGIIESVMERTVHGMKRNEGIIERVDPLRTAGCHSRSAPGCG